MGMVLMLRRVTLFFALLSSVNLSTTSRSSLQETSSRRTFKEKVRMLGAAINEKKRDEDNRSSDPDLALSLATVFGLNHYPNYLYRFSAESEELSKMESLLQRQLEKVQKQRKEISTMTEISSKFLQSHPLDSTCSSPLSNVHSLQFWLKKSLLTKIGCPAVISVQDFISSPPSSTVKEAFAEELEVEGGVDGIFTMEFFTEEACEYLSGRARCFANYLHNFSDSEGEEDALKEFKKRPPPLIYMGFGFLEELLLYVANIIAPLVFPECINYNALDWSHGYIVGYSDTKNTKEMAIQRSGLVTHTDDSEITCNIALNDDYEGGELVMHGMRGDIDENDVRMRVKKNAGTLIIHSGRRLHEVAQVQRGSRYHLICWTRSLAGLRRRTCPCCWMNNRRSQSQQATGGLVDDCICGEWWN